MAYKQLNQSNYAKERSVHYDRSVGQVVRSFLYRFVPDSHRTVIVCDRTFRLFYVNTGYRFLHGSSGVAKIRGALVQQ